MAKLPDFKKGQEWSDQQASELRALVAEARKIGNLQVGPGLRLETTGDGIRISLLNEGGLTFPRPWTAVLVGEPGEDDRVLQVRRVRFRDVPPYEGEYEWDGDAEQVYPDFGRTVSEYSSFLWTDDAPTIDTQFLRVHRANDVYVAELPATSGGNRWVVVRSMGNPGAPFVLCAQVVVNEDDDEAADLYRIVDAAEAYMCIPNLFARHYAKFVWEGPWQVHTTVQAGTHVLPATQNDGVWYVHQFLRYSTPALPTMIARSDCRIS